jgi:hypothetical protein
MALRKRIDKRREPLTPTQWKFLCDLEAAPDNFERWVLDTHRSPLFKVKDLWETHRDEVLAQYIADNPGSRPSLWWHYDAPRIQVGTYPDCFWDGKLAEPRGRLGGVGTPRHECLAYVPHFSYGLPTTWVTQRDVEHYARTARGLHGDLKYPKPSGTFEGVAVDPDDPPTYESQAAYLERHGLFLPGERKRLMKNDFEPERMSLRREPLIRDDRGLDPPS